MSHAPDVLQCTNGHGDGIFKIKNELQTVQETKTRDLVVAQEIQWLHELSNLLIGGNVNIIPVIHAASPIEFTPKRPPPMKYQDLPIYESPHYEYKDYIEDSKKCPKRNVKILHTMLYPHVQAWRRSIGESVYDMAKELRLMKNEIYDALCKQSKEFKNYMRCKENLALRQAVVAAGTLTGIYIGSGSRGFTKKMFFGSLGALAAGALCFPKETDEIFRDAAYNAGKLALALFNLICKRDLKMRERLPCFNEVPQPPPTLQDIQNPKCKKT